MYQLDQIRVLEIETINNCNAACPQCMRTNHETLAPTFFNDTINWPQIMRNIPKNFWGQLKTINFKFTIKKVGSIHCHLEYSLRGIYDIF